MTAVLFIQMDDETNYMLCFGVTGSTCDSVSLNISLLFYVKFLQEQMNVRMKIQQHELQPPSSLLQKVYHFPSASNSAAHCSVLFGLH